MNELEFRERVYANPSEPGQEILDAAQENPALQKILDEAREFDAKLTGLVSSVVVPEGLKDKLLEIPDADASEPDAAPNIVTMPDRPAANASFFQYYAIAASLLLVIGVTFTLSFDSGPSDNEIAMGDEVIRHIYAEAPEFELLNASGPRSVAVWSEVDTILASTGAQLSSEINQQSTVFHANPCIILPEYTSAHLMMEGGEGVVNVFVIQNSPVTNEFQIRDDRFDGLVVPFDKGNLILVGEDGEDLEMYKELVAENMEWVI